MTHNELNIVRQQLNAAYDDPDELRRLAWLLVYALTDQLLLNDDA